MGDETVMQAADRQLADTGLHAVTPGSVERLVAEVERLRDERDALLALCRAYHLNAQAHAWAELGGPRPSWAQGDDAEGAWAQYSALGDDLQAALPDALRAAIEGEGGSDERE